MAPSTSQLVSRRSAKVLGKALDPNRILKDLLAIDNDLVLQDYYSERSVFYNPGRAAPLGVIFASIKEHDGPNDARSDLNRAEVYRFAFQVSRERYENLFGRVPPRPGKGEFVRVDENVSQLDVLTPHPIYAWMRWVQVLCPTPAKFDSLLPALEESLASVRERWDARSAAR